MTVTGSGTTGHADCQQLHISSGEEVHENTLIGHCGHCGRKQQTMVRVKGLCVLAYHNTTIQNIISCSGTSHPEDIGTKNLLLQNSDVFLVNRFLRPQHAQQGLKVLAKILLCHLAYKQQRY